MKGHYNNTQDPNRWLRHTGLSLTPLMRNKIQYGKMKKQYNMDAVVGELRAREIAIPHGAEWMNMIALLKTNENGRVGSEPQLFPI